MKNIFFPFILIILLFSVSSSYAHKAHQDVFIAYLKNTNEITSDGLTIIQDNISSLDYEVHYTNSNKKLEKNLYNVLANEKFNIKKYQSVMKSIFATSKHEYSGDSALIINKLSKNDRIALFNAMVANNLANE